MKATKSILVLFTVFVLTWAVSGFSQEMDLELLVTPQDLQKDHAQQNLDEVIGPLLDLFGFYTGGGLYHTADIHGLGGFDVGVRVVTMMVKEDQKPNLPWPLYYSAPTNGVFSGMSLMPLPLLQASVGLPGSVEATGRFFTYPMGEGDKKGNITLIGLGLKYGLLQNMLLPRISVAAAYHYLTVPDEFDFGKVSSFSGALLASKDFAIIELYGGVGIDYNKLEVDLLLPDPIGKVTKKYDRQNMRYNLGIKIKPFPLLFIHADYNFGDVQGFNAGLGVSLR
jgi:opacity protein-like surface antigen